MKIPANNNEITLYCLIGEALLKTQIVEQALSHSITLKLNPFETKGRADEILERNQSYTLGHAIKIAVKDKLYDLSLQSELNAFLKQRNWLVHHLISRTEQDFNNGIIREELLNKIKSVSNRAEKIQRLIEYDIIDFCSSMGKDMSKIAGVIKLNEEGVRIRK